ncbi:winged helix-turn-helix domain-containing protein [Streptomyces sp. NPDC002994]|uniref:winged helix-turn-helix domain-containing protein n=1 Tax=Streptomyces sp. NPDC002994 TaxID=3154441 RepID=UPI0033BDE9B6
MVSGQADGGGKEFQRVADALHTQLTDGTYRVGDLLPVQRVLAERFGVSRDTVQRVLRELADEGWIHSRQGSGTRVVKTQRIHSPDAQSARAGKVTLGPLIAGAFEAPVVTLDVFTLTSQSLDAHIHLQAVRVRAGEIAPQRITVRLLVPSEEVRLAYPRHITDDADPRPLQRLHAISRRHLASLGSALFDLRTEGLVPQVDVEVKHTPLTPSFKLYLLNGTAALHGLYEVVERPIALDDGEVIDALDVLGLGATLFHYVKDQEAGSQGSLFVDAARSWFDSHWNLLST